MTTTGPPGRFEPPRRSGEPGHPAPGQYGWDPTAASRRAIASRRMEDRWRRSLWVLAAVVVVLAAVTVGVVVAKHTSSGGSGSAAAGAGGTSSTTTEVAAAGTPGGPSITALNPSSGGPGQSVVITGSGLVSSNGQVLASFGSVVAPTSCSSSTTCTATAPPGSGRVQVTLATASGTSNGLWFTYR